MLHFPRFSLRAVDPSPPYHTDRDLCRHYYQIILVCKLYFQPYFIAGLCFQGFLDACYEIARRTFFSQDKFEMMDSFISYCKVNLQMYNSTSDHKPLPKLCDRRLYQRSPYYFMPKHSFLNLTSETVYNLPVGGRNYKIPSTSEIQTSSLLQGKPQSRRSRKSRRISFDEE